MSQRSSIDYLKDLHAEFYLNDALALLLKARPERPLEFLHDHFTAVRAQQHVVSRDFTFINATTHNRVSFLKSCRQAFGHIDDGKEMVIGDLYQLVTLLCPTMPEGRIYELPRLLKLDTSAAIPFRDLITAFSVHFAFYDALLELKQIFVLPLLPGSPLEWRSVDLDTVRTHLLQQKQGRANNSSADLHFEVPLHFIETAFSLGAGVGSGNLAEAAPTPSVLAFDELVFRLLKNQALAVYILRDTTARWRPRDACPVCDSSGTLCFALCVGWLIVDCCFTWVLVLNLHDLLTWRVSCVYGHSGGSRPLPEAKFKRRSRPRR